MLRIILIIILIVIVASIFLGLPLLNENKELNEGNLKSILKTITNIAASAMKVMSEILQKIARAFLRRQMEKAINV